MNGLKTVNPASGRPTTRSQSRDREPSQEPTVANVSDDSLSTVIRNELPSVLSSEEFLGKLTTLLVPAVGEAVKEKVYGDLHDDFQLELASKQSQLDTAFKKLESFQLKLDEMARKLEVQEQYSRRNCLRIHGITESQNESTDDIVIKLAKDKMNLFISPDQIDRSHRITPRLNANLERPTSRTKPRSIIVKFACYNTRDKFYRARTSLKGTGIFVNEDLTPEKQNLFSSVRRHERVKRSWTLDGKILVIDVNDRKWHINSSTDLGNYNICN